MQASIIDVVSERYRSYSQLSTYAECPRRFQLEKVARVPRRPGFWFPGGTAVHATVEAYLREAVKCDYDAAEGAGNPSGTTATGNPSTRTPDSTGATPTPPGAETTRSLADFDVEETFQAALSAAYVEELNNTTFEPGDWFTAGRGNGEDISWWVANGAQLARNFITWYEASPDFHVWIAPDGRPAIELDLTVQFGEVPVRMVIDLVLQVGYGASAPLIVTDLKSGSTKPKNERQLGIYACGLEREFGIRPRYGTYFMCRGTGKDKDSLTYFQPVTEMSGAQFSYEYLTVEFGQFDLGAEHGIFPAAPGESCRRCGVAYACTEVNGEQAKRLDPNYPLYLRKAS
jgi:hypothetical protein